MRKIYFVLSLAIAAFMFSCGEDNEKKANDAVVIFLDSLSKGKDVKVLVTPESQATLDKVNKDKEKYKKEDEKIKKAEVKTEIVSKKVGDKDGDVVVKFTCNGKEKIDTLHVVKQNDKWLVVVPEKQVSTIQYVVFYGQYEEVVKLYEVRIQEEIRIKEEASAKEEVKVVKKETKTKTATTTKESNIVLLEKKGIRVELNTGGKEHHDNGKHKGHNK